MVYSRPTLRAFTLSAFWAYSLFSSHSLLAQVDPPDPDEDEMPFSVAYHVLPHVEGTGANYAYAINSKNQIVGDIITDWGGYTGGEWWPIETDELYSAAYAGGGAYDINDDGEIASGTKYDYAYDLPYSETDVGSAGGSGVSINNSNQVVGSGWVTHSLMGPVISNPNGEESHNAWFKVVDTSFPAMITVSTVSPIGQEATTTQKTTYNGTYTYKETSKYGGIAWSIDEEGYCVGVDANGPAVLKYGGGYRQLPSGAEKRLISISKEGIVCGTKQNTPAMWPRHGTDPAIPLPLPDDASGGVNYASAASDTGWIIGQVGGYIHEKEDKEWGGGRAFAWKQQGVDEQGKPKWLMLDLSKHAPKGWKHLTLFDINREGKAVGFAQVKGDYRAVMLELGPQLVALDANRDGTTLFEDDELILNNPKASDLTTVKRPFRFWLNSDQDEEPNIEELQITHENYYDDEINGVRDLEDLARLKIRFRPDWKKKIKEQGYSLKLTTLGDLKVKLFKEFRNDKTEETDYLTKSNIAAIQVANYGHAVPLDHLESALKKIDFATNEAYFLWEGLHEGKGSLRISLCDRDGKVEMFSDVQVDLHPVTQFFAMHEAKVPDDNFPPPYESLTGFTPVAHDEVSHYWDINLDVGEEERQAIVFVHGWRMPPQERENWSEMVFKRLWHGGFKGRFYAFSWFTYSEWESFPEGLFTYNKSEHRAWVAAGALKAYLAEIHQELPSDYTINICSHSMGNIVVGEAIRQGAQVDRYVMMQAAASASSYDTRTVLAEPKLVPVEQRHPTPQLADDFGYVGYFRDLTSTTINFFNEEDFALRTGKLAIPGTGGIIGKKFSYVIDQKDFKPDPATSVDQGSYDYRKGRPALYVGRVGVRRTVVGYECMAFIARSITNAAGAENRTGFDGGAFLGPIKDRVDLNASFGFNSDRDEHSAQFTRSIQNNMVPFYTLLRKKLTGED